MAKKSNSTNTKVDQKVVETPVRSSAEDSLPFGKSNYTLMLIGIAVILIGFIIMTQDKEEFGFGFLGLTLGPLVVFSGFVIEIFAILRKKA